MLSLSSSLLTSSTTGDSCRELSADLIKNLSADFRVIGDLFADLAKDLSESSALEVVVRILL